LLFLNVLQMKTTPTLLALLITVATATHAQTSPEATAGTAELQYSARYSQSAAFYGGSLGDSQEAILSGNLNYANGFKRRPLTVTFGGGYNWNIAGTAYGDGPFENFAISQGIVGRKWSIQFGDNVSYLKEAPITGFSGEPGTGEPISGSNPTPPSDQSILTLNTRTVSNNVNGEYQHNLNFATSLSVGGSSELLRYPDGNGLDTNAQSVNAGLTRRLNARNSLSAQYSFTDFSYPGNNSAQPVSGSTATVSSLKANTVLFGFQRQWNRRINTSASIGPEWIGSPDSAVVPSSTRVSGNATVQDQLRFGSANLTYSHAASAGGGFLPGAEVDTISGGFGRTFEKKLTINLTGGYDRTSALGGLEGIDSSFGAGMATLQLSQHFSAFANYTATNQSSTGSSLPANALSGLWQMVSFGIGYTPREKRIKSQ
jgi:hypothetical protein